LGIILLFAVVGCGKEEAREDAASGGGQPPISSQLPPADVTSKPGDAAVTESAQAVPVEGLFLNPYFDDAGTVTESAVKPGATFTVHVFGEVAEPNSTNAIQYRIEFPAGVEVVATNEFEHKSVSTGDPRVNYMLAYDCQPAGRFRLVTYVCQTTPEFTGGEIKVLEGLPATGINFIGFVSCEFVEMRATGGTATLTAQ
jgi:hypothetical protein